MKMTDYMNGRQDGIEALEKEVRFRNLTGIHTSLAKKDLEKASMKIKEMTIDTFTVLAISAARDEFDFGPKRCKRLLENMNRKAECLMDDMITWQEMTDTIREELGFELKIRMNG